MKYIDIHCHLGFPDYDQDREEIIKEMQKNEITAITVGVDFETSKKEVEIAQNHENIFACVGQHPENLDGFDDRFADLAKDKKVVAIGECGLDYFAPRSSSGARSEVGLADKTKQKEIFERQISLALELNKPLMLHIRPSDKINFDAYFDALDILEERFKQSGGKLRGNAHYFVGNLEVLKRFLDIGFTVSFAGAITFAREYDESIKYAPPDSILSETDAPLVAPVPHRGKRNEPGFVVEVVKRLAELKKVSVDEMASIIMKNAKRVFGLSGGFANL